MSVDSISKSSNNFAKTICAICYEDLKPITEDLQSISICGHVFHELCLQQWFEYCPSGKKNSCPVCKQQCTQKSVNRLYFQSISESTQPNLSQKPSLSCSTEADFEALRAEMAKLQGQMSVLNQAFESQQQHLKELNVELSISKGRAEIEEALKVGLLKEKTNIQQLLVRKNEELAKSTAECSRLQKRSMALAKEVAAHKLVSDLDLDEEEVLRLASIGRGANSDDTINILKKSLILRNKSYKELMAQCNLLGRGESRSARKLGKAVEKIKKLKARLQELERALEEKDNEALRALKLSTRISREGVNLSGCKLNSGATFIQNQNRCDMGQATSKENIIDVDLETRDCFLIDNDASAPSPNFHETSGFCSETPIWTRFHADVAAHKSSLSEPSPMARVASSVPHLGTDGQARVNNYSSCSGESTENGGNKNFNRDVEEIVMPAMRATLGACLNSDAEAQFPDILDDPPLLPINKGTIRALPDPISRLGDQNFPGGLPGSKALLNKHAGKWCKKVQSDLSPPGGVQGSSISGELIAVGADGRGGRIKVLRAQNHFMGGRESSSWGKQTKRCKYGVKQSGASEGCLQIEHFFQKTES